MLEERLQETNTFAERGLADRLAPRVAREKEFARTGRTLRNKSWLFRHEKQWLRPILKAGLSLAGLYGRGLRNALTPAIRRIQITYPHLPPAFDGYTVLHLSDLHIDGMPDLPEALAPLLAKLDCDLCLITGDYRFEDEGSPLAVYPLMRQLRGMVQARDGVFAILGNHDISPIALELDAMGYRMLINEAVEIRRDGASIWVAGVDDPFDYQCDDLPGTLEEVPHEAFKILMVHTPELSCEAAEANVALYLCGHTHAGQIQLPHFGCVRHNCECPKEFAQGHWRQSAMHGYTSAGVGCSALPVRFRCPPELILFELRSGEHQIVFN